MTTFTGPLKVKQPFSETVVQTVDASGTATFATEVIMSATTRMTGPVRIGRLNAGYAYLAQSATVAHNNSASNPVTFDLPVGADIIEIYSDVQDTFDAGSLGTAGNLEVGVSGSTQMLANIPVSASGTRLLGSAHKSVSIARWNSFTSHVGNGDASGRIQVFVTARSQQATAMTVGKTYLTVVYVQRS